MYFFLSFVVLLCFLSFIFCREYGFVNHSLDDPISIKSVITYHKFKFNIDPPFKYVTIKPPSPFFILNSIDINGKSNVEESTKYHFKDWSFDAKNQQFSKRERIIDHGSEEFFRQLLKKVMLERPFELDKNGDENEKNKENGKEKENEEENKETEYQYNEEEDNFSSFIRNSIFDRKKRVWKNKNCDEERKRLQENGMLNIPIFQNKKKEYFKKGYLQCDVNNHAKLIKCSEDEMIQILILKRKNVAKCIKSPFNMTHSFNQRLPVDFADFIPSLQWNTENEIDVEKTLDSTDSVDIKNIDPDEMKKFYYTRMPIRSSPSALESTLSKTINFKIESCPDGFWFNKKTCECERNSICNNVNKKSYRIPFNKKSYIECLKNTPTFITCLPGETLHRETRIHCVAPECNSLLTKREGKIGNSHISLKCSEYGELLEKTFLQRNGF